MKVLFILSLLSVVNCDFINRIPERVAEYERVTRNSDSIELELTDVPTFVAETNGELRKISFTEQNMTLDMCYHKNDRTLLNFLNNSRRRDADVDCEIGRYLVYTSVIRNWYGRILIWQRALGAGRGTVAIFSAPLSLGTRLFDALKTAVLSFN